MWQACSHLPENGWYKPSIKINNRVASTRSKGSTRKANNAHNAPPTALDNYMNNMSRLFADMSFNVIRPNGTKITLWLK